jgi:hypothetical protein
MTATTGDRALIGAAICAHCGRPALIEEFLGIVATSIKSDCGCSPAAFIVRRAARSIPAGTSETSEREKER